MVAYEPLISVLIPSYNHASYIKEAIESIRSQDYKNLEIVVVDDFSTDGSRKILKKLSQQEGAKLRLFLNEKNEGVASTINVAIKHARGELVALLASDDLFLPDRFSVQLKKFSDDPRLRIIYADGRALENGKVAGKLHGDRVFSLLQNNSGHIARYLYTHACSLFLQTALIKKTLLLDVGGLDGNALADDWLLNAKFFSNMKSSVEYAYVNCDVIYYRQHDANVHKDYWRQSRLKLEFIEKFTPENLKSEGFANIHYDLARLALKSHLKREALRHFVASQKAKFSIRRMKFITKFLRSLF